MSFCVLNTVYDSNKEQYYYLGTTVSNNNHCILFKQNNNSLPFQMLENHSSITRAFVAFDTRGDGFVTLDELKRVLFNFAFPMSDKLFVELMSR